MVRAGNKDIIKNPKLIGVLMGGLSEEREISLRSGGCVYRALRKEGLETVAIDLSDIDPLKVISKIKEARIDFAFIALHGRFGEDGTIQKILEDLDIPYTGSDSEASRLGLDKVASRKIFKENGIPVPFYIILDKDTHESFDYISSVLSKFPLVIKPASSGSSIGLSIIDNKEQLNEALEEAFQYDHRIIIEEYIRGRELTVGILDDKALPIIEIIPKLRFFNYQAKYSKGMTDYIIPAELQEELSYNVQKVALKAHMLLGCRHFSRIDMILNEDNIPVVLELNSIPGLISTSLLPKAAKLIGIEFNQLCIRLIKLAWQSHQCKISKL